MDAFEKSDLFFRMFSDGTCMSLADDMSCKSMIQLAKQEFSMNRGPLSYMLDYPACERLQELADREKEYVLQKPLQFARNVCMQKKETFHQGEWEMQHAPFTGRIEFDTWTRRRVHTPFQKD